MGIDNDDEWNALVDEVETDMRENGELMQYQPPFATLIVGPDEYDPFEDDEDDLLDGVPYDDPAEDEHLEAQYDERFEADES